MDLISVIVPVYNVERYLPACLESLCSQTYENLQIILVDDGSTDSSGAICDSFASRDKRILALHQPNGGVSAARNLGLSRATGDYIGFVDADDTVEPDLYAVLLEEIKKHDCDAAFCNYVYLKAGSMADNRVAIQDGVYGYTDTLWAVLVRPGYITAVWNKLFRRSVVWKNDSENRIGDTSDGGWKTFIAFRQGLTVGEDQLWLGEVLEHCKRVYLTGRALYHWNIRENSASRTCGITKQRMDELYVAEDALDRYGRLNKKIRTAALVKLYLVSYLLLYDMKKANDRSELERLKRDLKVSWKDWLFHSEGTVRHRIRVCLKTAWILTFWRT